MVPWIIILPEKPCFQEAPVNTSIQPSLTAPGVDLEGLFQDEQVVFCSLGHKVTGFYDNVSSYLSTCRSDGHWSPAHDCFREYSEGFSSKNIQNIRSDLYVIFCILCSLHSMSKHITR